MSDGLRYYDPVVMVARPGNKHGEGRQVLPVKRPLGDAVPNCPGQFLQEHDVTGVRERGPGRQNVRSWQVARSQLEVNGRYHRDRNGTTHRTFRAEQAE